MIPALAASLLLALVTQTPAGQEQPKPTPPSQDPSLTSPTVAEDLLDQERQRPAPAPIEPDAAAPGQRVIPSVPGIDRLSFSMPNRKFRFEGAYVAQLPGTVIRIPTGDNVFLPDLPADNTPGDQPMLLMPCQRLSQIQAATEAGREVPLTISGQAFVYRGRQYLLPSAFTLTSVPKPANGVPTSNTASNAAPTTAPDAKPADAPAADPRVDDLIHDLETRSRGQRLLAPPVESSDAQAPQAAEPQANLLPEGDLIMNRRGRLVRLAGSDGRFAMVFDNDPNSPSTGPLVILPCRVLETMEGLAMPRGDEATFRVSGRVLVHEGRNYLLPTLAQIERPGDLMPLQ